MGDRSSIEWTDATWNPLIGCSRVSPGCDHCYAIGVVHRGMSEQHRGLTIRRPGSATDWNGRIRLVEHLLDQPARWTKPRRVFVNSLSDLFHPEVLKLDHRDGSAWPPLVEIFAMMASTPRHTYQVLTKRPQLMAAVLQTPRFRLDVNAALLGLGHPVMPGGMTDPDFEWPRHLWMGTSIESDRYTFRADHLRATPAAVRWLSQQFARFVPPPCHPGCVAHNDQAISEFAGWLGEMGVDLDDPHQLHATLAALSIATRQALYRPLHAGASLGCHVNALAARIPGGGRGE